LRRLLGAWSAHAEVYVTPLAADPARVFQHALDDVVGGLPVLDDLLQVADQH
jgi:hypothetical protein